MKNSVKRNIKKSKLLYSFLSSIKNFKTLRLEKYYKKIFSNAIEGRMLVNFKNIPGQFEIDIRSDILKRALIRKEYEPAIVNMIDKSLMKDLDAINVGANIGIYTNFLANALDPNRKVLAIEPTPNAFQLLERNTARNQNDKKVIAFNGVASRKKGDYALNLIKGKEEYSSIGNLVHASVKDEDSISVIVKGETIDSLVDKYQLQPGIIVIDVEGAELEVLKGSLRTLKTYKPIIVSEIVDHLLQEQNSTSKEIVSFLENLDYEVMNVKNEKINFPFNGNIVAKTTN